MELKLTKEQAEHLESLLDSYLRDLSHEITATDNPEFRAGLRARRAGLAGVAGAPGLTVSADGPGLVKISADLGVVSATATARVTRAGPGRIRITVVSTGGIPASLLGSLRDITLPLPALPMGMTIRGVSITGQGVLVRITARNVSFGG